MWLTVLREGLVRAARRPLPALILYLVSLAPAVLAVGLAALAFGLGAGDRPWAVGLLGGEWLDLLVEIVATGSASGRLAEVALPTILLVTVGGLAWLLQALLYALVAGGILERLGDAGGARFWPGCRRWFWPFVRLGLLGTVLFVALAVAGTLALDALDAALGAGAGWLGIAVWLAVLGGWLELARAGMVARGDPGAAAALGRAARLALRPRRLPHLLAVWLVLAAIGAGVAAAQVAATDEPVAGPVLGQVALFAGAWLKVARLATALALDRQLGCAPETR